MKKVLFFVLMSCLLAVSCQEKGLVYSEASISVDPLEFVYDTSYINNGLDAFVSDTITAWFADATGVEVKVSGLEDQSEGEKTLFYEFSEPFEMLGQKWNTAWIVYTPEGVQSVGLFSVMDAKKVQKDLVTEFTNKYGKGNIDVDDQQYWVYMDTENTNKVRKVGVTLIESDHAFILGGVAALDGVMCGLEYQIFSKADWTVMAAE